MPSKKSVGFAILGAGMVADYGTHKTLAANHWLVRTLTERQIRRGTPRSTVELENAIRDYLVPTTATRNHYVWTKQLSKFWKASSHFACELLAPGTRHTYGTIN